MNEILLTLRDVAEKSGAGFRTVQRHVAEGKLRTSRLGKLLHVVSPQEFETWFCAIRRGRRETMIAEEYSPGADNTGQALVSEPGQAVIETAEHANAETVEILPTRHEYIYRLPAKLSKIQKALLVCMLAAYEGKVGKCEWLGISYSRLLPTLFGIDREPKQVSWTEWREREDLKKRRAYATNAMWRAEQRLIERGLVGPRYINESGIQAARVIAAMPEYSALYAQQAKQYAGMMTTAESLTRLRELMGQTVDKSASAKLISTVSETQEAAR